MKKKLSVIIVSYNTKDLLEQCLQAIFESKNIDKRGLEVIVVDNNSSDGSSEMVNKKFTQVKLITNNENIGYSAGNNIGMTVSTGSYVLLLNSDAFVRPETLKTMLNYMEQDPAIGASTCSIELPSGKLDPACHRGLPTPWNAFTYFTGLERLFPASRIFGGYHQSWKDLTISHEVDSISGAFFLVRREVVQKVGLLDEQFFMYGEDIDWCYRIKQSGFHIMFNPSVKVLHYKKQSGRGQDRDRDLRKRAHDSFIDTMWQFYQKHYSKRYPFFINWLVKLGISILSFRAWNV